MLALAGCACILFAEVIKQWKSIFGFLGNVVSAMTPIIIGLVIAFMLNPIMIYIRRGLSFLICKIKKEAEYDRVYKKVKVPALILTVLLFLGLLVGLLWLVIPRVYESLTDLVNSTEDYINSAEAWIKKVFAQNQMIEDKLSQVLDYAENNVFTILKDKIMPNLDTIVKTLSSGVVVGIKAVMNFLIGLIVMIYLLMSKDVLLAQCKKATTLADGVEHHLEGDYNRFNVAAAVAVGRYFGVDDERIRYAVGSYRPDNHRSQKIRTGQNTLILDCYNANPSSMQASLVNFRQEPLEGCTRKILILGDMLELGDWSDAEHRHIISLAAEIPDARILLVGPHFAKAYRSLESRPADTTLYPSQEVLAAELRKHPVSQALILVKGSHSIGLERLADLL